MIEFRSLRKQYGTCVVLDIPYVAFDEGSCTALLGVNGSGKSTFLKLMAARMCSLGAGGCHKTGYLPQTPYGFRMSVRKNIELVLQDDVAACRGRKAEDAMEKVGIQHLGHKNGHSLSGGETQRMALARLLAQENEMLILDEPTSACDLAGSSRIEQVLKSFQGTIIFSTHSPAQAVRLSDRVIFLQDGRIGEDGKASKVFSSPESAEFRDFLTYWRF